MRLGILALAALAAGCATVARGTSEQIQFDTVPSGAEVRVIARSPFETSEPARPDAPPANTLACVSPCVLQVKRNEKLAVTITKSGYETESFPLDPQASGEGVGGAILGNALLGGIAGVVVDSASGAMLDHCPNPVRLTLRPVASPPARGRAAQPPAGGARPAYDPVAMCKAQNAAKYGANNQDPPPNM